MSVDDLQPICDKGFFLKKCRPGTQSALGEVWCNGDHFAFRATHMNGGSVLNVTCQLTASRVNVLASGLSDRTNQSRIQQCIAKTFDLSGV